jgi:hypothetical protein
MEKVSSKLTVGTAPVQADTLSAGSAATAYWDGVLINRSNNPVYLGSSSAVTVATGTRIDPGQSCELRVAGAGLGWWLVAATAGNAVHRAAVAE